MATLSLRSLTKNYGHLPVVRSFALDIADGEFVSLLGPSGCGKSTILNMIAGLIPQDGGEILIGGKNVSAMAPKDRRVAMVFQDYALYPHMTVEENIGFPLKAISTDRAAIRERVGRVAASLGLTDLLHRLPRELSGGQRQRVALGRAIVREPAVFLMDEPLSNLDAKLRIQTRAELKLLSRRLRTTTVYVTHDQAEAMTLSDRIAIIDHGVLQQCGTPQEVYNRPANVLVAGFMGAMPMNFVTGRIERGDGHPVFVGGGCSIDLSGVISAKAAPPARPVLMGVRPEDLVLAHQAGDQQREWPRVEAVITMIEDLGADLFIYAESGGSKLIVRGDVGAPVSQGPTSIHVNPAGVHFFDAETQVRIGSPVTRGAP